MVGGKAEGAEQEDHHGAGQEGGNGVPQGGLAGESSSVLLCSQYLGVQYAVFLAGTTNR